MASVFTKRLVTVALADADFHPLVSVPEGHSWVVRDIVAVFQAQGARLIVYVTFPGGQSYLWSVAPDAEGFAHIDLRQALVMGDVINAQCSTGVCYLTVTGYDFLSV